MKKVLLAISCTCILISCLTGCVSKKDRQQAMDSVSKYAADPLSYMSSFKGEKLVGDEEFTAYVISTLNNFSSKGEYAYVGDFVEKLETKSYNDPEIQKWLDSLISQDAGVVFSLMKHVEEFDYYTIECNADTVYSYIESVGKTGLNLESGYYDDKDTHENIKYGREYGDYGTYRDYEPQYCGDMCFNHYTGYGIQSSTNLTTVDLDGFVIYYKGLILNDAEDVMRDAIIGKVDFENCITLAGHFLFAESKNTIYVYDLNSGYRIYPVIIKK